MVAFLNFDFLFLYFIFPFSLYFIFSSIRLFFLSFFLFFSCFFSSTHVYPLLSLCSFFPLMFLFFYLTLENPALSLSFSSLSSLLFLFFYFFYSWQYIVNFSPHISCIILQLHGPSQTKVHNMKNLIWERERESQWRTKTKWVPLSLSLFHCSDFIWFIRKKTVFMFGLCFSFCSRWDREERKRVRKEEFFFFSFNQMIILSEKNGYELPQWSLHQENYCSNFKKPLEKFCF